MYLINKSNILNEINVSNFYQKLLLILPQTFGYDFYEFLEIFGSIWALGGAI